MNPKRRAGVDLFESSRAVESRCFSVSELTANVRSLLEERFGLVRVTGEIS